MVETILHTLKALNVKIDVVDERLDVKAPKGVLTTTLIEDIKSHKQALINFIKEHKVETDTYKVIKPVQKQAHYPLSSAQRRLWILSQFEQESVAYNMSEHSFLNQNIDLENFKNAILKTIERHEILRTVFREDAQGEVRQFVQETAQLEFTIQHHDYSGEPNSKEKAVAYINQDSSKAFDLENGPLLRVAILQLENNTTVFYYNMHHIISDGWSMNVLTHDVMHFYDSLKIGTVSNLDPLDIQYKDFTVWQQQQLQGDTQQAHNNYWKQQLAGELPTFQLPTQKKRPLFKSSNGATLSTYIDKNITKALRDFCNKNDGSLFMGLLTTANALFYRYTSQDEFIIGTPTAGRDHVQLENQIGCYLNTIALRTKVGEDDTLTSLFSKVRKTTFDAYEHQQYPFDQLVEELQLKRDKSRTPIFDVMLQLQNFSENQEEIIVNDTDEIIYKGFEFSKYDLTLAFQEVGDYLSIDVTFNTDIYDKIAIEHFMIHFKNMLTTVLENTNEKIRNLNYLTTNEAHQILYTFNDTKEEYSAQKTIVELFATQVEKTPTATAVIYNNEKFSYSDIDTLSNTYADYLYTVLNVRSDDKIVVVLAHDHQLMAALLAIKKIGAIYVPVDPTTTENRIAFIKENSKSIHIVNQDVLAEMNLHVSTKTTIDYNKTNDIEFIIYTSGSTGLPKGVLIKSSSVNNRLSWMWKNYPFQENEVCCAKTSISFVDHIWEIYGPLLKGIPLVFFKKEEVLNINEFVNSLYQQKISRIVLVPSLLRELIQYPTLCREKLKNLNLWISSGEVLKKTDVENFYESLRRSNVRLLNIYGSTEVTADATYYDTYEDYNTFKEFDLFDTSIKNEIEALISSHDVSDKIVTSSFSDLVAQENFSDVNFTSQLSTQEYVNFLKSDFLPNVVNVGVPSYVGHMTSIIPNIFRELNTLVATINQNQVKIETSMASTLVEKQVVGFFHNLIFAKDESFYNKYVQAPDQTLGVITNGGTLSNIMALNYSLNQLLGATDGFEGIAQEGIMKALQFYGYTDVVLLGSRWCHYSFGKAMKLLGLGTRSFVELDYEDKDTETLKKEITLLIEELRENNVLILGMVGIAGATESGNIDPLVILGEIANKFNIHYHVDAAFGGSFMMDEKLSKKLNGIQLANSVSICAHKQLYIPIGLSICLFQDPTFATLSENNTHYQARKGSYDLGRFTIEGSRNFMSLLLHAALKIFGKKGFSQVIRYNYETAQGFAKLVEKQAAFRLLYKPDLNIVLYRYIPVNYRDKESFTDNELEIINDVNRKIQQEQFKRGNSFVSYTAIKKKENTVRNVVFRTVFMNPYTSTEDLKSMLEEQKMIAASIENTHYISEKVTKSENVSIGKPIGNVKVYILDRHLNILPIGITGEICVGGECVSKGYIDKPEDSNSKFVDNPFSVGEKLYKSGDLGIRKADGNIEYVGRKDDMIKIFGNRVELGEIEYQLSKYEEISKVVVLTTVSDADLPIIVAYIVAEEKQEASKLRAYLLQNLPTYMLPSHIVQVDNIPLNASGKVDKKALLAIELTEIVTKMPYVAPKNEIESKLINLCEEILNLEQISIKDNFYDIGGNSIKLMRLLFKLKINGYSITPENLLSANTMEEIAKQLKTNTVTSLKEENKYVCPTDSILLESINISENQKHMMKYPESQAVLGPFVVSEIADEVLIQELQHFLSHFPELHIDFTEKDGKVYQQKSVDKTVKIETIFKTANLTNDVLENWQTEISKQKFDILHDTPIRLYILKDNSSNRTWFCLAMSHVLVDLHSALILHEVLEEYISKRTLPKKEKLFSSIHYAIWQKHFLASNTGKASREFWKTFLKNNFSDHITNTQKSNELPYISETFTIVGSDFKAIQAFANRIKVSVSVVFMAYHEYAMEKLFEETIPMQLILVNGREDITDDFDVSKVIGVINNVLPLPTGNESAISFSERCTALQIKYINARQHQGIPFEIIRNDFMAENNVDIAVLKNGAVNFQQLPGTFSEAYKKEVQTKKVTINRPINFDMICKVKQNGIQVELICSANLSEKLKKVALTPNNILKYLP